MIDAEGLYQAWLEEYGATAYQILGIPGSHWFGLLENGQIPASKIEEIAEIATGRLPRRRNDDDIILYSVECPWRMLRGQRIFTASPRRNIGTVLNLWDTPALA
ncbi:hypothetical protein [Arthrobacter sp. HMWF013]|uniref:hypothetical protein n=1 Tax=Arthrobacter sp. HMWF013 TaxID=2056849 RepID=UPI001C637088|nr:hypothetical protein [Arthrobacter sp. HMWF013]